MKTNTAPFFSLRRAFLTRMAIPVCLTLAKELVNVVSGAKGGFSRKKSAIRYAELPLFCLTCISTPAIATGPPVSEPELFSLALILLAPMSVGLLLVGKGRRLLFLLIAIAVYSLLIFGIFLLVNSKFIASATLLSPWILIFIARHLRVERRE